MNDDDVFRRIVALETEARALRTRLAPPKPDRRSELYQAARREIEFFAKIVPGILLVSALIVALYGWRKYHVFDLLERQRQVSIARNLSRVYTQSGNELLLHQQLAAAEEAFTRALEYRKDNEEATFGLEITRVARPVSGQKTLSLEVMRVKIDSLLRTFPDDRDNRVKRSQIFLLKGQYYLLTASADGTNLKYALDAAREAIRLDPSSPGGYILAGYVQQLNGKLTEGCDYYDQALSRAPGDTLANNNTGFCALLHLDLDKATSQLEKATNEGFSLATHLNLASAYIYQGRKDAALSRSRYAVSVLEPASAGDDPNLQGSWLLNFMPLGRDDKTTANLYLEFGGIDQKRSVAHLYNAISLAAYDKLDEAAVEVAKAHQLDPNRDLVQLFDNRLVSAALNAPMSNKARVWLIEQLSPENRPAVLKKD